ncbi:unnamed protein product [Ectocarpus sp. 6 AP-2014]
MRTVRVNLPLAVMLGLAGSSTAFLQSVRPTNFVVPAHKYNAAVSRTRAAAQPRPAAATGRGMRIMSAAVDETETTEAAAEATLEEAAEEIPVAAAVDDPISPAMEDDDDAVSIALEDIVVGEEYEGVINNVVTYGAFVDIGTEVNGLVHISQLADEFVANCDDHVKEGDMVRVRVLNVDGEARKLVLSMRQKPRSSSAEQGNVQKYADMLAEDPSQFVSAKVENIVSYGAFFGLEDGCSGFVHISQMSPTGEHVADVSDVLAVGQVVDVRIREVDEKLGRINMSLLPYGQGEAPRSAPVAATKDVSHLAGSDPTEFRKGTVSAVADYGLFVNIEGVDGLLHVSKMSTDRSITSDNIHSHYEEGQEVEIRIMEVNTANNKMSLSMLPPTEEADFGRYTNVPSEEWLEGTVVSIMNYGAFVRLDGDVDGMVHISQLDPHGERVDSVYNSVEIGQDVRVRILEADPSSRKLRLTMREEGYEGATGGNMGGGGGNDRRGTKKTKSVEQFLNLSPEEWISGRVASITHFGAFVAVDDDTDGLLHISQIAEDHVSNVEDHLQIGQEVQVRVIEVDVDNCRLGLSMREPRQNSPRGARGKKDVSVLLGRDPDEFIPGRVVSIVPYGAFVNIEGNIDGLVHISEMAIGRVDSVEDVCEMGQEVQVRISDINTDNNTVNLSMVPAGAYDDRSGGGYGDEGFGAEGGRRGRGGGRGRGGMDSAAFGREDFADTTQGGEGGGGADWQQFLNNYFDDKE